MTGVPPVTGRMICGLRLWSGNGLVVVGVSIVASLAVDSRFTWAPGDGPRVAHPVAERTSIKSINFFIPCLSDSVPIIQIPLVLV